MSQNQESPTVSPLAAFGVLLGVIAVILGFLGLVVLLSITEVWAGFLFLLYWGGIQHLELKEYPAATLGSLFGLLLIYLAHNLGTILGLPDLSLPLFLGVICTVVYLQILGKFSLVINLASMLFLTVGTIPQLAELDILNIAKAVALSALYFGLLAAIGNTMMAHKASAKESVKS
ncbi:MAG: hypothetical protein ACPF9H_09220 [Aequoribacter sp.]|uniref:hypothetical protein n=1 Tax=Aequoribacter sp. TaxID=2847771 RepID=UPI003C612618